MTTPRWHEPTHAQAPTFVFGEARCPSCDVVFSVSEQAERRRTDSGPK